MVARGPIVSFGSSCPTVSDLGLSKSWGDRDHHVRARPRRPRPRPRSADLASHDLVKIRLCIKLYLVKLDQYFDPEFELRTRVKPGQIFWPRVRVQRLGKRFYKGRRAEVRRQGSGRRAALRRRGCSAGGARFPLFCSSDGIAKSSFLQSL